MKHYLKIPLKLLVLASMTLLASFAVIESPTRASPVWYVAPGGNDANDCQSPVSPCATINGALNKPGFVAGDTIRVAVGTYAGSGAEVVLLNKNATLSGGWDTNFVAQSGMSTLNGGGTRRGITVSYGTVAKLERFNVQNGLAQDGGGIWNSGILTVTYTTISDNTAGDPCCTGYVGGGIGNGGTLVLNNSTVSGNRLLGGSYGSGIYNSGSLTLNNSTVSDNDNGEGIYSGPGAVSVNSSTIYRNGRDGIMINGGSVSFQNTIVAYNLGFGCNYQGAGSVTSLGYNIVEGNSGCNLTGSDLVNIDPTLGPLQNNGGLTPTRSLLANSPAFNSGNPAGCSDNLANPLPFDQRGGPRVGRCDIGAVEMQALETSIKTVNTSNVPPGGLVTYTIALNSVSDADVHNVVVTDTIPASLTYQINSLNATSGSYNYQSGIMTWTGSVNAGQNVTITFGAKVDEAALGNVPITNTALIDGGSMIFAKEAAFRTFRGVYLPIIAQNYCPGPLYADDFSNPNSGWPISDIGNVQWAYVNGEYSIWVRENYWWGGARPGVTFADYSVVVDARNSRETYGSYGIIFGQSEDGSQFYTFEIFTNAIDGSPDAYGIYRYSSGTWTALAEGTSSSIHGGIAWNHMKVLRSGSLISVYANGQLLTSISDASYVGLRHVGLIASSYIQYNVDARFDNFAVYSPSCPEPPPPTPGPSEILDRATMNAGRQGTWTSSPNDRHK